MSGGRPAPGRANGAALAPGASTGRVFPPVNFMPTTVISTPTAMPASAQGNPARQPVD